MLNAILHGAKLKKHQTAYICKHELIKGSEPDGEQVIKNGTKLCLKAFVGVWLREGEARQTSIVATGGSTPL